MRWWRTSAKSRIAGDPQRQEALVQDVRQRFGPTVRVRYAEQVDTLTALLCDDDGLLVAARVVREVADEANAVLRAAAARAGRASGGGYLVDRRNYRTLWRTAEPGLVSPLFSLRCGFHPYIQVAASVAAVGGKTRRCVRLTDPAPLLAHMFEVLDLVTAGWEFGRVPVDADAAGLVARLIAVTRRIRDEMHEEPPLPDPVRELMRRNNITNVYDPTGRVVIGGVNLGEQMRSTYLT
jgi:hypothetical protein